MGIQRSQEDSWTREMRKWEQRPVLVSGTYIEPLPLEQGGKKDMPFQEYPKMLYQAESRDGGPRISDMFIVHNIDQELIQIGRGWSLSQEDALKHVEARQLEAARLDAERQHNERWMSGKASAEAAAIDEMTIEHVASIPETPIKPRGKSA